MDVHVPYAITAELRLRGIDVLTAQEDGSSELDDRQLLDRAGELKRLLVTQDVGFLREAARRRAQNKPFGGIVYASQLGITIGECVRDLELIARASQIEEWLQSVQYLPLR
jgi:predicted nuclease of predicted toxin-antitoxin system